MTWEKKYDIINTDNTVNTNDTGDNMNIKLSGKENIYEQIVREYKRFIELKVIRYGEKMPSCRSLAMDLGINPNTVVKAYAVLEEEGYIQVLPKKGVYVTYNKESSNNNKVAEVVKQIKSSGVSYDELIKIVNDIYRR